LTRTRLSLAGFALGLIGLIALAGCGSSSTSTTASSTEAAATSTTASSGGGAGTIDVADNPKLGQVLVDSQGHTVYMFEKDESDESYCNGSCAKVWPPVTTKGQPKAGSGVSASKLTTLKRDDGSTQVVFDGHPLYTYVKDEDTEDAYGNGLDQFGAEWYGLTPNGQKTEEGSAS
jgi:predicted lipoprotein with Yx(FWY)xxD motif